MKKQYILAGSALALVFILFFFGRTVENKEKTVLVSTPEASFDINSHIDSIKKTLSPHQSVYIGTLENSISRGDVVSQKIASYTNLANFWKDSAGLFEPYAFYTIEAAKLENSEKNLTFAAQLILEDLRHEQDESKLNWKTAQAIELFERALKLNPGNVDLRIGIGTAYVYGKGRTGNSEATMKGIQQLLSVVREDPDNMKAQMVLGVGGFISGQYDKAVDRFKLIVEKQPSNLEAIVYLADTYAAQGKKADAIKWYNRSKEIQTDPRFSKQVDERIKELR